MSCGKAIDRKVNTALSRPQPHEYHIDAHHILGSGSYSVVRRAVDRNTGVELACKEISHQSRASITCLQREVTALHRLAPHQNIVQLCHVQRDTDRSRLFLTSPRGSVTLRNYLDEHVTRVGPLSESEVRVIFRQLLTAVAHCHVTGVAHRDLKLENVLIVPHSQHVTLIDFGLALVDHVTHVTEALGSPLYMSPELLNQARHSATAADMWALGVVLHQLLFQHFPYMADSFDELHLMVSTHRYTCPAQVSPLLSDLLSRLFAHDATQRVTAHEALHHAWLTCCTPR
jgi:serine/threonine protein kinase